MQQPSLHAEIMACPKDLESQLIELIKEYKAKLRELGQHMENRLIELCQDQPFKPMAVCCPEMKIYVNDWKSHVYPIQADIYSSVGPRGPRGQVSQPQVMYIPG